MTLPVRTGVCCHSASATGSSRNRGIYCIAHPCYHISITSSQTPSRGAVCSIPLVAAKWLIASPSIAWRPTGRVESTQAPLHATNLPLLEAVSGTPHTRYSSGFETDAILPLNGAPAFLPHHAHIQQAFHESSRVESSHYQELGEKQRSA